MRSKFTSGNSGPTTRTHEEQTLFELLLSPLRPISNNNNLVFSSVQWLRFGHASTTNTTVSVTMFLCQQATPPQEGHPQPPGVVLRYFVVPVQFAAESAF